MGTDRWHSATGYWNQGGHPQEESRNWEHPFKNEVAFFLASQIDSNIRVLEGSLIRIGAFASLTKAPIDMQTAKEVLKNIIKPKEEMISIDLIQKVVSTHFNIKISDLKIKRKYKGYVAPKAGRHVSIPKNWPVPLAWNWRKFGAKITQLFSTRLRSRRKNFNRRILQGSDWQSFMVELSHKVWLKCCGWMRKTKEKTQTRLMQEPFPQSFSLFVNINISFLLGRLEPFSSFPQT